MSGPPYPPQTGALSGSNTVGGFVIGTSQIGSIKPFDAWRTIISQYANSPVSYTHLTLPTNREV